MSRPISLSPVNRNSIIDLESSLSSSENAVVRSGSIKVESPEHDTGDSRTAVGIKVYFHYPTGNNRTVIEPEGEF